MEERYDISVDIGEGKDWWRVHGLTTHEMVYELNKQMCDLGKTMNDPIGPCSEETAQEVLRVLGANMAKQLNLIDMKEKKTVQEWRDEFAELYAKMREELGAKDLDVYIHQSGRAPVCVSFDIKL